MSGRPKSSPPSLNAATFVARLTELRPKGETIKNQKLKSGPDDVILGVRMKAVFDLAKEFAEMPLEQVEELLDSAIHEVRVGAVSVMDKQARGKRTPESRRRALYELYRRRHDRIDHWDLVDRAAPWVVGGYLFDTDHGPLYELARSDYVWERRTAIVSTYYFIRQGDVEDTFALAEILLDDDGPLMHNAVGSWIREAGRKDEKRLLAFLDEHASTMPRLAAFCDRATQAGQANALHARLAAKAERARQAVS